MKNNYVSMATGRRKTSSASVRLCEGSGVILVNKKPLEAYFPTLGLIAFVKRPLEVIEQLSSFDVHISVRGGGTTGQAGAARRGLALALVTFNGDWRQVFKPYKFLTSDPRVVERKKPGQAKARKKFQWVKR